VRLHSRRAFLSAAGSIVTFVARAHGKPSWQTSAPVAGTERVFAGMRCCWCPPGRFAMGSSPYEAGHRPDEAQVEVQLSRGFWMGKFEVSQGQWRDHAGVFPDRSPDAQFGLGDDVPVYWVSYADAERYCGRLTAIAHESGALPADWTFRLPTEAQWEYGCRAGTTTAFAFGEQLRPGQANCVADAGAGQSMPGPGQAAPAGRYPANPWGLHDMHGNVFEWCRDWYHARLPGGRDPDLSSQPGAQNRDGSYSRCRRGGAWSDPPQFCRSALRLRYEPERRSDHIGFRVVAVEG
jgi:formylglycine-generating enzyme required for sulfatase activity